VYTPALASTSNCSVSGGSPRRTAVTAMGVVLVAPITPKEPQPLQFAQCDLACFKYDSRPSHCGDRGYCGSCSRSVHPVYRLWLQSPCFPNRSHPKASLGFVDALSSRIFHVSPLSNVTPRYLLHWLAGSFAEEGWCVRSLHIPLAAKGLRSSSSTPALDSTYR
jgi:hypothetical protein